MNSINTFNDIIVILSFIVNLFFAFPLLYKIYKYFTQKKYIKKILVFNNEPIQIYQTMRELKTIDENKRFYLSYDSLKSLHNIMCIIDIADKKFALVNR